MPAGISNEFVGIAKAIRGRCCKWATRQYRLSVESSEEGERRRAQATERARQRRATMSPEQTERMLACGRAWKDRNREHVNEYSRQYHEEHREEVNVKDRERYWADPEKSRAKARAWQANQSPESREKRLAYTREYNRKYQESGKAAESARRSYLLHREEMIRKSSEYQKTHREVNNAATRRFRARNPEKNRQWQRDYYKANPEKARANCRRRRAKLALVMCTLTSEQEAVILSQGCFFCGAMENLTIAHDVAVSNFGNTTRGNCFCLCQSCNSKMGTKSLADMLGQKELF